MSQKADDSAYKRKHEVRRMVTPASVVPWSILLDTRPFSSRMVYNPNGCSIIESIVLFLSFSCDQGLVLLTAALRPDCCPCLCLQLGQDSYDDKNKKRNRSRVFVLYSDTEDEMPQDEVPGKVGFPKPTGLPGPVAAGMSLKEVKLESVDKGPRFERAKLVAGAYIATSKPLSWSQSNTMHDSFVQAVSYDCR